MVGRSPDTMRTMADHTNTPESQDAMPTDLSRRDFVALSLGAGIAAATSTAASAQSQVVEKPVEIKTPDGTCDAVLVHPASGAHPGVLVWPDAFGLRPAMRDMGRRLAADGYTVLVPNPFYRVTKAPVIDMTNFSFQNQDDIAPLRPLMGGINAAAPRRGTRPRTSRSSTRSRRWTRRRRSARRATAWADRSCSGRRPRCPTASAPARRSTAAGW